jgi:hypothetical protein
MADDDLDCVPAPKPATPAPTPGSAPRASGRTARNLILAVLAFATLAGVALTLAVNGFRGGASASAAETIPAPGEGETDEGANAPDEVPQDCLGENPDAARRWYCDEFLPFAKKAAADHGRIDVLERRVRELEAARGGSISDTHPAVWLALFLLGGWTVYLTIRLRRTARRPT